MMDVTSKSVKVINKNASAEVEAAFPELDWLEKVDRERVVRVWARAYEMSEWRRLSQACTDPEMPGVSLISHTRAVVQGCRAQARIIADLHEKVVDEDRLLVLAFVHDVSKLLEYEPDARGVRTSKTGELIQHAVLGAHLCLEEGFSLEVAHSILTHTPQSKMLPKTAEAILHEHVDLADASFLHFAINGSRVPQR